MHSSVLDIRHLYFVPTFLLILRLQVRKKHKLV